VINKKENILSNDPIIELSSESLKLSRPSVVAALYNGINALTVPLGLKTPDRRFRRQNRYSNHLDWISDKTEETKQSLTQPPLQWDELVLPVEPMVQQEVTDEEDTTGLFQNERTCVWCRRETPESTVIAEKDES